MRGGALRRSHAHRGDARGLRSTELSKPDAARRELLRVELPGPTIALSDHFCSRIPGRSQEVASAPEKSSGGLNRGRVMRLRGRHSERQPFGRGPELVHKYL